MQHIQRSALVNHSAEQMFDLVNDIEAYPRFMPGCRGARVLEATEGELVGELQLGAAGVEQRLTTRNALERPHKIAMTLIEGDFTEFSAAWRFEALSVKMPPKCHWRCALLSPAHCSTLRPAPCFPRWQTRRSMRW